MPPAERAGFIEGARYFAPSLPAVPPGAGDRRGHEQIGDERARGDRHVAAGSSAGSAQLSVLPLFAAGLPLWTVWLTAAIVNLRFVIFSAGLQPHFSYLPLWRRTLLGSFNGRPAFRLLHAALCHAGPRAGQGGLLLGQGADQLRHVAGLVHHRHRAGQRVPG
ncbi:AzlC family ABC transporter permease [Cupriavidus basilensis]